MTFDGRKPNRRSTFFYFWPVVNGSSDFFFSSPEWLIGTFRFADLSGIVENGFRSTFLQSRLHQIRPRNPENVRTCKYKPKKNSSKLTSNRISAVRSVGVDHRCGAGRCSGFYWQQRLFRLRHRFCIYHHADYVHFILRERADILLRLALVLGRKSKTDGEKRFSKSFLFSKLSGACWFRSFSSSVVSSSPLLAKRTAPMGRLQ